MEGALPPELVGLYVRNGSNPRTGTSPHWFLGDGMVHGIRLEAGRATSYRNRYVRTPLYEASSGFGEGVPGGEASQSNVSAIWHGGRLLTSGEVGYPYELSPDDLSTMGVYDFGGRLTTSMTAHPKIDPATGQMHFFGYGFVPPVPHVPRGRRRRDPGAQRRHRPPDPAQQPSWPARDRRDQDEWRRGGAPLQRQPAPSEVRMSVADRAVKNALSPAATSETDAASCSSTRSISGGSVT